MAVSDREFVQSLLPQGFTQASNQAYNRVVAKPAPTKQNFFGNVAKTAGRIGAAGARFVGKELINPSLRLSEGLASNYTFKGREQQFNRQLASNQKMLTKARESLKAGKINQQRFKALVKDAGLSEQAAAKELQDVMSRGEFLKRYAPVAGNILTVAAPVAKASSAGRIVKGLETGLGVKAEKATRLTALPGAAVRNALVTQPTIKQPGIIAGDIQEGNLKGALGESALLVAPAAIGLGGKALKRGAPLLKEALVGKKAGPVVAFFGRKAVQNADPETKALLKQAEGFTLDQPNAIDFEAYLKTNFGLVKGEATPEQFAGIFKQYAKPAAKLQKLREAGKVPETAVLTADFRKVAPAIAQDLKDAPMASASERLAIAQKVFARIGTTNPRVEAAVNEAIMTADNLDDAIRNVSKIEQLRPRKVPGFKPPKGFVVTYGPEGRLARIPSLAEAPELAAGKDPAPVLGAIGTGLRKAGLGVEDYDPKAFGVARENFAEQLGKLKLDGNPIFNKLQEVADTKKLSDLRQLTIREIEDATGLARAEAKAVRKALDNAYKNVPLELRGAAGRLEDINIKYNPLARSYSRAQSVLRYRANPFFIGQQVAEPAILGQTHATGIASRKEISTALAAMKKTGFIRGGGTTGELNEAAANLPKIPGYLFRGEEVPLANTLAVMAKQSGQSVDQLLADEGTRQLLRTLVQYPSKGLSSSNLAKAMNLAFFPIRYNTKVTALTVKALAKQPAAVQFGVLKGVSDFKKFLDSDEGIKWHSENSELLSLLNYFTPINSIQSIWHLMPGQGGSVRDLGVIGGLPFGFISRALEGQGAIELQAPYIDPKTGEIIPDKIPTTVGAKVKQSLRDLIDTFFTFPGRRAGLGSKQDLIDTLTGNQLKLQKGEYTSKKDTKSLTPRQKEIQRVLGTGTKVPKPPTVPTKAFKVAPVEPLKITPVYKATKPRAARRGKTLAKRPGQF